MKLNFITIAAAALLAGCATTHQDWVMVGGSKADGTVILGIDIPPEFGNVNPKAEWDPNQADGEADKRCKNWGYGGAEMYRKGALPVRMLCVNPSGIPCAAKSYRVQYQCLGGK